MAGRITLWGASQMLQCFFTKEITPPESFYMALIKEVPPTPFVSGSEIDEPVGGGYQRVEIDNDLGYWFNDVQPQVIASGQDIAFLPATEDWGRIKHWALCDSPSGGNLYFIGSVEDANLIVNSGNSVTIATGGLTVSLGPFFTPGDT